ncbi:MAG: diacylglycerol kinase family protein [bacterium]|nr:diacylglycerol kinase [Deltaproteobacteria bacterium]MCP4906910.1 diacylglycerol kinase family protein [bacterium]
MTDPHPLAKRLRSFRFAFRGISEMLRTEANARIHTLASVFVLCAGFALDIGRTEWLFLTLTIAAVWSLEAVNTAFESLCDVVAPEDRPEVARAKDIAAAAVLIAAIAAVIVALLIFGRPILALVSR